MFHIISPLDLFHLDETFLADPLSYYHNLLLSTQATSSKTIDGPFEGKYVHVAKFSGADAVWSSCGSETILNINADARLDPDNVRDAARITVNTPEVVEVQWRRC